MERLRPAGSCSDGRYTSTTVPSLTFTSSSGLKTPFSYFAAMVMSPVVPGAILMVTSGVCRSIKGRPFPFVSLRLQKGLARPCVMIATGMKTLAAFFATALFVSAQPDLNSLKELKYRNIGPFRGGRSVAVSGVTSQPNVYYFGATGGGVWKTTDGGVDWRPVSDGQFKTGSVGAIGVSESDPNVVYVGMGEPDIRGNASHGDGVYKSTDAGKTWKRVGLEDTYHIGAVRVHPKNPDIVYVAAMGHLFGPNEERGLYRSTDGGATWKQIYTRGPKAGAVDIAIDPGNPRVLYAAFWEVRRSPWSFDSGGPGSGLFKSTDGGDTWTDLTRAPGMPKGIVGRIGITASPVNSDRVWAIVEAEDGGLFRSENGGKN